MGALYVVAVVVLVVVALLGVWLVGMRTKRPAVIDFQRRVNRRFINPRQMRDAGSQGSYAGIIRHVGRRSGKEYATPVVPLPVPDGFVVVLPYGTRSDWVRNVLAGGSATIVHEGETTEVCEPEIVTVEESGHDFSKKELRAMRLFGNTQCLRVSRMGER